MEGLTFLFFGEFPFLDTRLFADQVTQVEQACPAHFPALEELYFGDDRRGERENTLNPYAVGNFAYGKGFCCPLSFDLNDIAAEGLNPFFVTLDDFIADHDVVARPKSGEIPRGGQLLVNKLNGVHWYML